MDLKSPVYWDAVVDQLNVLTNQNDVDPATGRGSYLADNQRIDAETRDPGNVLGGGFLGVPIRGGVTEEFRALLATAVASLSSADSATVKAQLNAKLIERAPKVQCGSRMGLLSRHQLCSVSLPDWGGRGKGYRGTAQACLHCNSDQRFWAVRR